MEAKKPLLCRLGLHNWKFQGRTKTPFGPASIYKALYECPRCGRTEERFQRW